MRNPFKRNPPTPVALKERVETLSKAIGHAMEGGDGVVIGVLFQDSHCGDLGGVNGDMDEVIARLSGTFIRAIEADDNVGKMLKAAMAKAIIATSSKVPRNIGAILGKFAQVMEDGCGDPTCSNCQATPAKPH